MTNLNPDDLVAGVQLRRGQLKRQWCQMKSFDDSCDAVILIGFHAKVGTTEAILSHNLDPGFSRCPCKWIVDTRTVPEHLVGRFIRSSGGDVM